MNPLDWTGPEFLMLYVPLLVAGYVVARIAGRPRFSPDDPLALGKRLEPYEVALLSGAETFSNAVVTSLIHRGVFRAESDRLVPSATPPAQLASLERNVLKATKGQPVGLFGLGSILEAQEALLRERLVRKGLLVSEPEALRSRRIRVLVFGAVLALGVAKLVVGLMRDRPVGILFDLLVVGLVVGGWTLGRVKRGRTPLGDKTLAALQKEHQALRTTVSSEGSARTLSGAELALAVALFGTTALASSAREPMRQHLQHLGGADGFTGHTPDFGSTGTSSVSISGGGDSGGSDSGGGGGGGCGGCGGGGGGGCGGGGGGSSD
jgi:uncharacterized protein (TIGR04222 family)